MTGCKGASFHFEPGLAWLDDIILWTKPSMVFVFSSSQKVQFNLASVRQDSMKPQGAYFKLPQSCAADRKINGAVNAALLQGTSYLTSGEISQVQAAITSLEYLDCSF